MDSRLSRGGEDEESCDLNSTEHWQTWCSDAQEFPANTEMPLPQKDNSQIHWAIGAGVLALVLVIAIGAWCLYQNSRTRGAEKVPTHDKDVEASHGQQEYKDNDKDRDRQTEAKAAAEPAAAADPARLKEEEEAKAAADFPEIKS